MAAAAVEQVVRIDGILYNVMAPPMKFRDAITSRIKIMSKLDIAEKRLPQDGRIALRVGGRPIDVRVSTLPTGHGERAVLRHREDGVLVHLGLDGRDRLVHAAAVGPGPSVAKDIRIAEKLIAAAVPLEAAQLEDPGVPLRSILKAATA